MRGSEMDGSRDAEAGVTGPSPAGAGRRLRRRVVLGLGLAALAAGAAAPALLPSEMAVAQDDPSAITGFRSALFGMDEGDVRDAIYRDFGIGDDQVEVVPDATDGTTALRIRVRNLIEETGATRIDYVLGYARMQLMRVDLFWGTPADPAATPEEVRRAGLLLQRYFDTLTLVPESLVVNRRLESGAVVVFAGRDGDGRSVSLTERAVRVQTQDGAVRTLFVLRLSYIEDPVNPDIYRLEPGSF